MRRITFLLAFAWLTVSSAGGLATETWSSFRGDASAVAASAGLPTEWSSDKNVAWKIPIPGVGWSQPIVWQDKIFVTAAESSNQPKPDGRNMGPGPNANFFGFGGAGTPPDAVYQWKVFCLDAGTGKLLWERTAHEGKPTVATHPNNTYASETPATDGERLVAYFGMTGVYCYDLGGELLWKKDLGSYPMQFGWGTGSSPVLHDGLVFIQCDNDKKSFVVALDAKTGDERWRAEREERSNWSSPLVWKNKHRTELVLAGGTQARSYDPKTGELLWQMNASGRTSQTPIATDEWVFVDSADRLMGRSGIFAAVKAGASGDISLKGSETSSEHVAWSIKLQGYRVASPVLASDCIYVLEQQGGIVHCLDAATGKQHYRQRLPVASGFTASPWSSGDKVFCLDQAGLTTVLNVGPKMEVAGANKLDGMFWASPGLADGRLLVRSVDHLYCIKQ